MYDLLRAWPPFLYSKIDERIDNKSENNRRKYHKRRQFVAIIVFLESEEPESYEKESCPYDDALSEDLYESCVLRTHE